MIRAMGYSVLTQLLSSAGSLLLSLLLLRYLSLREFGQYTLLFVFIGIGSALSNSTTGYIYHVLRPRFCDIALSYERTYNGFNILVNAVAVSLAVGGYLASSDTVYATYDGFAILAFITSAIALESLKIQASANDQHKLVFQVEVLRQLSIVMLIFLLGLLGLRFTSVLWVQAAVCSVSTGALMLGMRWWPSFHRLGWVAKRHFQHARFLVPSTIIDTLHSGVIVLLAGHQFGPEAVGILRIAELPFSALNPLKSSLRYFLPGAIHEMDRAASANSDTRLVRLSGLFVLLLTLACGAIWLIAIPIMPLLTGKSYPSGIGIAYAAAYLGFFSIGGANIYMNVINRSDLVFKQSIVGAVVAVILFFSLAPSLGYVAAAIAIAGSACAMAIYSGVKMIRHLRERKPVLSRAPMLE